MTIKDNLYSSSLDKNEHIIFLSTALNKSKEFILAHPEFKISEYQLKKINNMIKRYQKNEPIAYILRNKEFYGLNYFVQQGVLIPRPETELTVDVCLDFFRARGKHHIKMLEIGTGTGCIPITLLSISNGDLSVDSIDISKIALKIAARNKKTILPHSRRNKLRLINQDIFKFTPKNYYDLIVSNPPYIKHLEINKLPENIQNHEPILALDGGNDGLKFYKKIKEIAVHSLKNNGTCILEITPSLVNKIIKIFGHEWDTIINKDYQGLPRVISATRKLY